MEKQFASPAFFAAKNSIHGFVSYFNEIFKRENYDKVFVLKGGPGTGKSTLMRKISEHFNKLGFKVKIILCSSDPNSLDGVIIEDRIAVIDGTSPHEADSKFPGVADEIVNLAEAIDEEKIKDKRNTIINLSKEKNEYYNSAYKYLSFLEKIRNYKKSLIVLNLKKTDSIIKSLVKEKPNENEAKKPEFRLLSSFNKNGYYTLDFSAYEIKKAVRLHDKFGEGALFLERLLKLCEEKHPLIIFPSALWDEVEGVYFVEEKLLISTKFDGEGLPIEECFKFKNEEELSELSKLEEDVLGLSQDF